MEMYRVGFIRLSHSSVHFKSTSTTRIACTTSSLPPQRQTVNGPGILCDPCGGAGWVVCDFCEGQKTNVKARNNRVYRRCPSCRALVAAVKEQVAGEKERELGEIAEMMQTTLEIQMEAEADLKIRTEQVRELRVELDELRARTTTTPGTHPSS